MLTLALIVVGGLAAFVAGCFVVGFLGRNRDLAGVLLATVLIGVVFVVWNAFKP